MSTKLLRMKEVCLEILSLQSSYQMKFQSEYSKYLSAGFTIFSGTELKNIQKQLESDSITNVLMEHGFSFPVDLGQLADLLQDESERPDFVSIYVLGMFLAWYILFQKDLGDETIGLVIDALVAVCSNDFPVHERSNEIKNVATSAIVNIVEDIMGDMSLITKVVIPIGNYITKVDVVHKEVYSMVLKITHKLCHFDDHLKEPIKTLIEMLMRAIDTKEPVKEKKHGKEKHSKEHQLELLEQFVVDLNHIIANAIVHMDPVALQFFQSSRSIVQEPDVLFFEPMLTYLMSLCDTPVINRYEPLPEDRGLIEVDLSDAGNADALQYMYMMQDCLRREHHVPDKTGFTAFMSDSVYLKMTFLVGVLLNDQTLAHAFNRATANMQINEKLPVMEQYALVYYVYQCTMEFSLLKNPPPRKLLWNALFWDPAVTVFHEGQNFEFINSCRQLAVETIPLESAEFIEEKLTEFAKYPLLYAEFVERLKSIQDSLFATEEKTYATINGIMKPLISYRAFPDNDAVKIARNAVLMFLASVFLDRNWQILLLSNRDFVTQYVSLLMEPPVRPQILAVISEYLTRGMVKTDDTQTEIFISLGKLVEVRCGMEDENDCAAFISDLLKVFNDAVMIRHSLSILMPPLTSSLCKHSIKVKTIADSKDTLMQLTSLLALTAGNYTIGAGELSAIENAIIRLVNKDTKLEIMIKLIQIVAGRPISVFVPNFDILQPKILCSYIRVFDNTEYIFEALDFVGKLCSYSIDNCLACHKGYVDQLIIDKLNDYRLKPDRNQNKEEAKDEERRVEAYLSLFVQIATTICSVTVVRRFISLLCPVEARYLSRYHRNFLGAFSNILIASRKAPNAILPLIPSNTIELHGIDGKRLENGFTFSFWLFMTAVVSESSHTVFMMVDKHDDMNRFLAELNGTTIHIQLDYKDDSYNGDIEMTIPIKQWCLISISFNQAPDKEMASVDIYMNNRFVKTVKRFLPYRVKGQVSGYINTGGDMSLSTSGYDNYQVCMGPFVLCKALNRDEVAGLCDMGPRPVISSSIGPLFAYEPSTRGDRFELQSLCRTSEVTTVYKKIESRRGHSFFDLFLNFCKPSIILPVFAQADIPYSDGTIGPHFYEFVVDILKNLFYLGERSQYAFSECQGFQIIAHLLQSCGTLHQKDSVGVVSFNVYLKLFSLMGVITLEELRKDLFDWIITNIDIWKTTTLMEQLRILRHWLRTVYPEEKVMFEKAFRLQWVLYLLHQYFRYSMVSENPEELALVYDCRQALFEIGLTVSKGMLSQSDYICVSGYLVHPESSWREIIDLLKFLTIIFQHNEHKKNPDTPKALSSCLPFIHEPLRSGVDAVVIETIRCICTMHYMKINIPVKFPQHVFMIMKCIQYHTFQRSGFIQLIDMMNDDMPELFPLVSMIAVNRGEEDIMYLATSMSRGQSYVFDQQTTIWPVMMLYRTSGKNRVFIGELLVSIFARQWNWLYYAVVNIGKIHEPKQREDMERLILLIMARRPRHTRDSARWLLRWIKHFIFFHRVDRESKWFDLDYSNSPYNRDDDVMVPAGGSIEVDPFDGITVAEGTFIKTLTHGNKRRRRKRIKGRNAHQEISEIEESSEDVSDLQIPESHLICNKYSPNATSTEYSEPNESLIGPTYINDMITESQKHDDKLKFALRIGLGGSWLDEELAKQALVIFKTHKLDMFSEMMCLIVFFLKKVRPDVIGKDDKIVKMLKEYVRDEFLIFLDSSIPRNTLSFLENMQGMMDLELPSLVYNFSENLTWAPGKDIILSDEQKNKMCRRVQEIIDGNRAVAGNCMAMNAKQWSYLWKSVTITRAPWHDSLPDKEDRYKRDNKYAFCFCPMRLRKEVHSSDQLNEKFMSASILRDTGSREVTEMRIREMRERNQRETPASILFKLDIDEESESKTSEQISRPKANEMLKCKVKKPAGEVDGTLVVEKDGLILYADNHIKRIPASEIAFMMYRTRCHRWRGFEIYTKTNNSILLLFEGERFRTIPMLMRRMPGINPMILQSRMFPYFTQDQGITDDWVHRRISNFEYLMKLNLFSGRSFNDLDQYPYFPWVLADYTSETLDLSNDNVYRDLGKPMGAIDSARLKECQEKYKELVLMEHAPFFFSACPMNSLSVCLYLLRLEPFTSQHINIQGGRFDHASRVFRSVGGTYKMSSTMLNDYREAIPEFYFLPDMLVNKNHFDLGKTSEGDVNDVDLPPWANGPFDFVYKNRKALESDYVSANLHKWIDLVWGYNQRGENAFLANNLYQPESYEDIWTKPGYRDPEMKQKAELMQTTTGQIPPRLFTEPHPVRGVRDPKECLIKNTLTVGVKDSTPILASRTVYVSKKRVSWQLVDDTGYIRHVYMEFGHIRRASISDRSVQLGSPSRSRFGFRNSDDRNSKCDYYNTQKFVKSFDPTDLKIKSSIIDDKYICFHEKNTSTLRVARCDTGAVEYTHTFPIDIEYVTSSGDGWFVVACKDAEIRVFYNNEMKRSISSFRESIRCASISSAQDMLVFGTKDQSLLFCSLNRCAVFKTIDIPGRPRSMIITRSMGMVLVEMTQLSNGQVVHSLNVYSVNGEKVNETKLKRKVVVMSTFIDDKGFDQIVMVDGAGDVFVFEAYPLEFGEPVMHVDSKAVGCSYQDNLLTVVCKDGTISMTNL